MRAAYIQIRDETMRGKGVIVDRTEVQKREWIYRKKDASNDYIPLYSINTHLHFDCGSDNWQLHFWRKQQFIGR